MKFFSLAGKCGLYGVALSGLMAGASAAEAPHREHAAHQHGVAQLTVAQERDVLQIGLQSPAMDIVGFEHAPANPQQRQRLQEAVNTLRNAGRLFPLPPGAACVLQQVTVDSSLLRDAVKADHDDAHEEHADFDAGYRYTCGNMSALRYLDVRLFDAFPGLREIEAQVIAPGGQRVHELTPRSARLPLQ